LFDNIKIDDFKDLRNIAIDYYNSKKDKLADEYDHLISYSIYDINNKFPSLNLFYDENGRAFLALTPEKPTKYMSSLYPSKIENNEIETLKKEYENLAKKYIKKLNINMSMSICQSPLIIPTFFAKGNENILKKYYLSEKLKGLKYISLHKIIDENLLDLILKSYNTWYYEDIFTYYSLNDVHMVFDIPEDLDIKTLSIELGKIAKQYLIKKNSIFLDSYKIPDMNIKKPVLMVIKTKVWNLKNINVESIKYDIFDKIKKSYFYVLDMFK
jgi:hypothetical protein